MKKVVHRIGQRLGQWAEAIPPLTLFVSLLLFTTLLPLIRLSGQQQGAGTTAAVVGSVVHVKPSGCVDTVVNGVTYLECGSTWYQRQHSSTQVSYVVVNPVR